MSSTIHFRFKSAREMESLSFEGDFLSIADLKLAIVERKKLNFGEGFDLEISDAATSDVFHDESTLVQKNTSVIVRRVPGMKQGGVLSQQEMASKNQRYAEKNSKPAATAPEPSHIQTKIEGDDEAARIASLVQQSGNTYVGNFQQNNRGRHGRGFNRGRPHRSNGIHADRAPRPSSNYVCHRCNRPGHWIDQCPTNGDPTYDRIKVRAPTGIPRSMLRQVDAPESGTGLQDSSGQFVTLQPNEEEFARQTVGLRMSRAAAEGRTVGQNMKISTEKKDENSPAQEAGSNPNAINPNSTLPSSGATPPDASTSKEGPKTVSPDQVMNPADSTGVDSEAKNEGVEKNNSEKVDDHSANHTQHAQNSNKMPIAEGHRRPPNVMASTNGPRPGMPPPQLPPGFPPEFFRMPFPPTFPPPPFLLPMMANGQNGIPPLPPGMMPPNLPPNMTIPPFVPPPMNAPVNPREQTIVPLTSRDEKDKSGASEPHIRDNGSMKDSPENGKRRSPESSDDDGDEEDKDSNPRNSDSDKAHDAKASSTTDRETALGRGEAPDDERERSVDHSLDRSPIRNLDSGLNSRSPNSPDENRRKRTELNRHRFDENDYRSPPPRSSSRDMRRQRISRSRSPDSSARGRWRRDSPPHGGPRNESPPPRRDNWRRDDDRDHHPRKRSDYDSDRERYRGSRYGRESARGQLDRPLRDGDRDRFGPPTDRRKSYSRRSPSPVYRRGGWENTEGRSRYDRSPGAGRREVNGGRGRRRDYSRERRSPRNRGSPYRDRRDASPGRRHRRRSGSVSRKSRFDSLSPVGDRFKRRRLSLERRSPGERMGNEHGDESGMKGLDTSDIGGGMNGRDEDMDRMSRRDEERRKREREMRFADDRDMKRRREGRRGDERRDRLSVHHRLGRAPGDRGNGKRRSIIDRLG